MQENDGMDLFIAHFIACRAQYCFTNSVCLSVCLSIIRMLVLCKRTRHVVTFLTPHCHYKIPGGTPQWGIKVQDWEILQILPSISKMVRDRPIVTMEH